MSTLTTKPWFITNTEWNKLNEDEYFDPCYLWDEGKNSLQGAIDFLSAMRFEWTDEDCPHCGAIAAHYQTKTMKTNNRYVCNNCHKKFTITTGTYLADLKILPLQVWRFDYLLGKGITNVSDIAADICVAKATVQIMLHKISAAKYARQHIYNDNKGPIELLVQRMSQPKPFHLKK